MDIATRTGFAQWHPTWAKPISGTWDFSGVDPGEVGRRCVTLHRKLADLHALCTVERLHFEGGIPTNAMSGNTNMQTIYLLAAMAGHSESFAYAVNARCRVVPQGSWRRHFLGKGSGYKTKDFKRMAIERCRTLGWSPRDDNEADALGQLDYVVHLAGIPAPWLDRSVFSQPQL